MGTAERPARILLIEDNSLDARLAEEALTQSGVVHELTVLADGELALAYLQDTASERPDLVILDLNIPKHDGLEVLAGVRLRDSVCPVPVVVLSSSDSPSEKQRAGLSGISAFLQKPLDLDAFLALGEKFKAILEAGAIRA